MNWIRKHRILIGLVIVELAIIDAFVLHIAKIAIPTAISFLVLVYAARLIGSTMLCAWCYRPWAMWTRAGARCCRRHRRILDRARRNLDYSRRDTRRSNGRSERLMPKPRSISDLVSPPPGPIRSARPDLPKEMIH